MKLFLSVIFFCVLSIQYGQGNKAENVISRDGYYAESHYATTEDGYILEINRIPFRRFQNETKDTNRPVVFLMHGLLTSAISYVLLGPEASIAYNLADAGYDVWLGNARGVLNSRNHVHLNPNNPEDRMKFFDYSFHEIGTYDISAMVDYVLLTTGAEKLHYIGHSQGGTAFLVLTSTRPEYNDRFRSVHLLAGVGHQENFPSSILKTISDRVDLIYRIAVRMGYVEILRPRDWPFINNDMDFSAYVNGEYDLQNALVYLETLIDPTRQLHASAAIKQIAHYGQNVKDKTFRRWDYGAFTNLIKYGRLTPPLYDLTSITADVTMHYTVNDRLLDERDVLAMASVMPNTKPRKLSDEKFLHSGFSFDPSVRYLVTEYIIDKINKLYES